MIRRVYNITGTIQGVGFRPALFRLAAEVGVKGSVQNRTDAVRLILEGEAEKVEAFADLLPHRLPPQARLRSMVLVEHKPLDTGNTTHAFTILDSEETGIREVQIPADLAICADCHAEINDPLAPRFRYPFTTCTNCGPRYTVVASMPYDRERTTLSPFPLCDYCRDQYEDPADRRFHAETIACPKCGPQLSLLDADGQSMTGDPIMTARRMLNDGKIVAVRGIGGFLLATDPFNRDALATLRRRKTRPDKPFAVMASDIAAVRALCRVSSIEADALESPAAPIVILDLLPNVQSEHGLPVDLLSPDTQTLGIMHPTSPLHALLLDSGPDDAVPPFRLLLMTSGNRGGEPIATSNQEALNRLQGIADAFLVHDREINLRSDDSLCIEQPSGLQVWRRARGYAPTSIHLPCTLDAPVLAMGAELKNAIALGFGNTLVLSPHMGDLESPEAVTGLEQATRLFPKFLEKEPRMIAVDLHPDMHATQIGVRIAAENELPVAHVQHHHAHALSCLAEHGLTEGLALVFDGTGYGPDGNIWGAELLDVTARRFERLATFSAVPLPGGDSAVADPRRQAFARWHAAGVEITPQLASLLGISEEEISVWTQQVQRGINCPLTHAAGRVFDAVASALGIAPQRVTYEGQAAIRLEALACQHLEGASLPDCPFNAAEREPWLEIDWAPLFQRLATDPLAADSQAAMAMAFNQSLALAAARMVEYGFSRSKHRVVALSGGVFMNRLLNRLVPEELEKLGTTVLVHHHIPPNDGGVAAGQVVACGG